MIEHFLFDCRCCRFFLGYGGPYDCMSKNMHVNRHARACMSFYNMQGNILCALKIFIGIVHCNFNILKIHED
jgi:hypothetical protein